MFPLHISFFEGWNSVLFVPCSAQAPGLRDLAEVFVVLNILLLGFRGFEVSWGLILSFYVALIMNVFHKKVLISDFHTEGFC
jgi:hypothetical protein